MALVMMVRRKSLPPPIIQSTNDLLVELKVTDICSTNPADATYCATPADIKIDRIKAQLLYSNVKDQSAEQKQALKSGTRYPGKVYWFFSKCWDDVCSTTIALHDDSIADNLDRVSLNPFTIPRRIGLLTLHSLKMRLGVKRP